MKYSFCAVVAILGLIGFVEATPGPVATSKPTTTRVALIDMAEVFRKYQSFVDQRKTMRNELIASEATGKAKLAHLEALKNDLTQHPAGSAEHKKLQNMLIDGAADYKAFRQKQQKTFLRKESEVYKSVYLAVRKQVDETAAKRGFSLVLRYNAQGVDTAKDPKTVLNRMNRLVVSHAKQIDITAEVIAELNRKYQARRTR